MTAGNVAGNRRENSAAPTLVRGIRTWGEAPWGVSDPIRWLTSKVETFRVGLTPSAKVLYSFLRKPSESHFTRNLAMDARASPPPISGMISSSSRVTPVTPR